MIERLCRPTASSAINKRITDQSRSKSPSLGRYNPNEARKRSAANKNAQKQ